MWGILTSLVNYIVGWKERDEFSDEEDLGTMETDASLDLLIDSVYSKEEHQEESLSNVVPSNVVLTRVSTGKITNLFYNDGLIDGEYFFERKHAPHEGLDVGKTVTYHAMRKSEESAWKVTRIIHVHEEQWFEEGEFQESSDPILEHVEEEKHEGDLGTANRRTIVGRVVNVRNRDIVVRDTILLVDTGAVKPRETIFSLNNDISSDFVPVEGDILSMNCIVEVSDQTVDGSGEVLEVLSIKAARARMSEGFVTYYDKRTKSGIVNDEVHFLRDALDSGYVPKVKDEVKMEIIECDKEIRKEKVIWRAVKLHPISFTEQYEENVRQPQRIFHRIDPDLLQDKGSLVVMENTNFGALSTDSKQKIEIYVTNTAETRKFISKYFIETVPSNLTLVSPKTGGIYIEAKDYVVFSFDFDRSFCSCFTEVFVIQSENFQIGRLIQWEVVNKSIPEPAVGVVDDNHFLRSRHEMAQNELYLHENRELFVPYPKQKRALGFRKVIVKNFAMPAQIRSIMTSSNESLPIKRQDSAKELKREFPELSEPLSNLNHKKKFHTLLYIAEMDSRIDMGRYAMKRVKFVHRGEYLALEVAGLSEGRMSLLSGDTVYATSSWSPSGGNFMGMIKKVLAKEILIEFDRGFRETYNSEDYNVSFCASRSSYIKCHHAVEICEINLAYMWLFPKGVSTKPPQIMLKEDEDFFAAGIDLDFSPAKIPDEKEQNGSVQLKNAKNGMKLEWFNKRLNHRQKEAVRNILRGEARPLPYIIFGPPGTGKTMTLVETILQIYMLMGDSRIIIATPSNSAANLIAERLLDSNLLQPGDMTRLVSHHVAAEGRVPPRLLPYSATVEAESSDSSKSENGTKKLNNELITRHRVIIGTCVALGQILFLGVNRGHFSHIIVDEAGQATEPEILIPLGFLAHESGQIVLAGDPLQLGPVVPSSLAAEFGLDKSLLARLISRFPYVKDSSGFPDTGGYDPRLVTRLSVNYRSLPDILELPSSLFYDCDLEPWVQEEDSYEAKVMVSATNGLKLPNSAVVFRGIKGHVVREADNPSFCNMQECIQVVTYVQQLLDADIKREDIGIITPYQKQVQKIKMLLEKLDSMNAEDPSESAKLKVGSVEEFQGQEKLVIIVSTVRSIGFDHIARIGRNTVRQLLGFVNSPERLNVAISRARALLIICGDPEVLCIDHYWRSVVKYCVDKGSYRGVGLPMHLLE